MSTRNNPERQPPALTVSADEALSRMEKQLAAGSELMAVTMLHSAQDFEGFRLQLESWRERTTEHLRRIFDQEEYSIRFYNAATFAPIRAAFPGMMGAEFSRLHGVIRGAYRTLEDFHALVQEGAIAAAPVERPAAAQPRFRDIHIHIDHGSALGQINIDSYIESIQGHINALAGPDADTIAAAFKELTESAITDGSLDDDSRRKVIEHYDDLVEQANTPPEQRRRSRIEAALERIPVLLRTAKLAHETWDQWAPTIGGFFQQ